MAKDDSNVLGFVYYIPIHNYIGQSVQPLGKRFQQHIRSGKDVDGVIILQSNIPKAKLNDFEAYWIGAYNAYSRNTPCANHTRGTKAIKQYLQGMKDMGHH